MQFPANDVPNYGNTFAQASTTLFTSTCYHSPIAIREERNTVFNQATNGKKWNPIPTGWTVWNHVNSQFLIEIPMFVWLSRYFQLFDIVRITILTFFGVMKFRECCWENCIYPTFSALENCLLHHLRLLFLAGSFGPQDAPWLAKTSGPIGP